jgi:uroporphyrinogen-III synthase
MTMRLLITRPIEDADALALKLERLGHQVIVSPLVHIAPRADIAIPKDAYQLIALTSANAIRCLAGTRHLEALRHLPVFAVGPQSAWAARQTGFAEITEAGGDGKRLAQHIIDTVAAKAGPILYLSGLDTASDFSGRLERAGFGVRRIIVYEARAATALRPDAAKADGVLLYSPRSARLWLDLSQKHDIAAKAMVHYCLSTNIAAILPDDFVKRIAAQPTEDSLVEIIGRAA